MTFTAQLSTTLNRPSRRLQRRCLALSLLSTLSVGIAQAQPISDIYMLGDSGSDAGTYGGFKRTNLGDMWFETLSNRLGHSASGKPANETDPANEGTTNFLATGDFSAKGGNNYSASSAQIVSTPTQVGLPDQVNALLRDHGGRLDRHALILIENGSNDIPQVDSNGDFVLASPEYLKGAAQIYAQQVGRLQAAGARNIVALTPLDFALSPLFVQSGDPALLDAVSQRTALLNSELRQQLKGTGVYLIDTGKVARDAIAHYTQYGFTVGNSGYLCQDNNIENCQQTPNDGHLFADDNHLSSAGQLMMADYIQAQLRARDQFASLLTQPMVAMRQETAGLEARLTSNAFLKNNANGQPARRAVGDVQAYGGAAYNRVNNDSTGGFDPGAKGNSTGGTVGADVIAADKLLLGGKLSYSQFDGDFGAHSGDYQRNTTSLSAYGAWQPLAQTTLNFALTYGYLDYNNITRKAQLGSVAHASAKGDTSGDYVAARIGGGYDFALQDWTLTPNAALTYERVKLDGYSEKTSVLAIAYGDSTYNAMRGSLGLNLALTGGTYKVRPYARMSLEHDFRSGDLTVYAGPDKGLLAGYDVTRPDRTFGMGTLGANVQLTDRVGLNLNYNQTLQQNHFSAWTANVGLQLDF